MSILLRMLYFVESLDIDSKMFVRHSELKDGLLQTYQMLLESHNKKMNQLDIDSREVST
jgi:hypothetical protein